MKKTTILVIAAIFLCFKTYSQVTEKFHRLTKINTDSNSILQFCSNGTTTTVDAKVNIIIGTKLTVGTLFYYTFDGTNELWRVTYSQNTRTSDDDYTIQGNTITPVNICNSTNTAYKLHRLQFIGSTLSQAQSAFCGITTYAGTGMKVDIQRATPLLVGKVYLINNTSIPNGYYYVHFAAYYDGSDEDANISGSSIGSPLVFTDSDNDGLVNACDSCPTQVGPSSNNGCPVTVTPNPVNPDLKIEFETSEVFSSCQSCWPWLDMFFASGKRHLIAGEYAALYFNRLQIRNIGTATSSEAKVDFYWSVDQTLEKNNNTDKLVKSVWIPSRNVNSSYGIQTQISGFDIFGEASLNASSNGNYYILIEVDVTNSNNEGTIGETNNFLAIPITFNSNITATSLKASMIDLLPEEALETSIYSIEVYNFSGQKVLTKNVSNVEEENLVTQNLAKGIYIIKSKNGDRKIFVN